MTTGGEFTPQAINVKISMRIMVDKNQNEKFSLSEFYQERQSGRIRRQNSFRTKLIATNDGLILLRGSWWANGLTESKLNYREIIKFSRCSNKRQNIMMLITNRNGEKEFLIIKSKAAPYLVQILDKGLNETQMRKRMAPQPNVYNLKANREWDLCSVNNDSNSSPPATPARRVNAKVQLKPMSNIENDEISTEIKPTEPRLKVTRLNIHKLDNENGNFDYRESSNKIYFKTPNRNTPKTARFRSLSENEFTSSVTYYNDNYDKRASNPQLSKPSRSRRSEKQEMEEFALQKNSPKRFDDNNTPWEVNISYIKHDPMVGCVEDESGPIYMYSAHQLVPRLAYGYNSCESAVNSSGSSDDDDENSTFDGESGSSTYEEEENELEKFILSGRDSNSRTPNLKA